MKTLVMILLCTALSGSAAFLVTHGPYSQETDPMAVDEEEDSGLSESEVELYIDVYSRMQADHSLHVEQALIPHGITLAEFRAIEREIQDSQRLVDRVREALLERAKQGPTPMGPPDATPR